MANSLAMRFKLTGMQDLFRRMASLKAGLRGKILRAGLGPAGTILKDAVRQHTREETGLLKKSMGRVVRIYSARGIAVVIVGPRTDFKRQVTLKANNIWRMRKGTKRAFRIRNPKPSQLTMMRNPIKYAHLVDLGTYRTKAYPFRAPGHKQAEKQAEAVFRMYVERELAKYGL